MALVDHHHPQFLLLLEFLAVRQVPQVQYFLVALGIHLALMNRSVQVVHLDQKVLDFRVPLDLLMVQVVRKNQTVLVGLVDLEILVIQHFLKDLPVHYHQ